VRLLIDENLSPLLAQWANAAGFPAEAIAHVGLAGATDTAVWRHAYAHDQVVVTVNVGDFLQLAASAELHPGVIALREAGLSRDEQWQRLRQALEYLEDQCMVNQVLEVFGDGAWLLRQLPPE